MNCEWLMNNNQMNSLQITLNLKTACLEYLMISHKSKCIFSGLLNIYIHIYTYKFHIPCINTQILSFRQ